jgi:hypothetical protein
VCGDKTSGTIFSTWGMPFFPSFSFVSFLFRPFPFFIVDNQAFGSDKGKSFAKDQSDIISLDDLLVNKLGAGLAHNYSFGVHNCKQVGNAVKGSYLLISFSAVAFFSIICMFSHVFL